jgi:uncharacterized protein
MQPSQDADLGTSACVNLTTYRRDGTPVTTPVWIVGEGGRYYVGTTSDTGKAKRLHRDARVRVVACNRTGRQEFGPAYEGRAHRVEDDAMRRAVQERLRAKYGRWVFGLVMLLYRLRGRYRLRMVLELDLHKAA